MAYEADKVVVELIAKTDQLDAPVKQSATQFDASMEKISASASKAEKNVGKSTVAAKDFAKALAAAGGDLGKVSLDADRASASVSRFGTSAAAAAQRSRNLGFQISDVGTQLASGSSPFVVLAQQGPQIANALDGAKGAVGRLAAFLSNPYGAAVLAVTTIVGGLLLKHREEADTVEDLVDKLKEHHDRTVLSTEAQSIFDKTVAGSIDAMKKLTDEIDRQNLTLEDNINLKKAAIAGTLADIQTNIGTTSADLAKAVAELKDAQLALNRAKSGAFGLGAEEAGPAIASAQRRFDDARKSVGDLTAQLLALSAASQGGARALDRVDFPLIERNAKNAANPIAAINQHFDDLASSAKKAGTYTQAFADNLEKQRAAAIKAAEANDRLKKSDPIGDFKKAVIGAEGTGKNLLGSKAEGFGQFMPSTFEGYFKQLFPQQAAALTKEQIDALRNNRQVAEAVIEAATNDYVKVLKSAGQQITAAALYTMHMLSAGDPNGTVALRLLNAPAGTSARSIVGNRVVAQNGNIFTGTAGEARAELARRIGDSSSSISSGAAAAQAALNKLIEDQDKLWEKIGDDLHENLGKEQDITDEITKQKSIVPEIAKHTLEAAAANDALRDHLREVTQEMDDAKRIGADLVDDVLNPDNWNDWGDAGKRELHDLMNEMYALALLNPIKNMLFGGNLPTLGGIAGLLSGGFDQAGFALTEASNATALGLPANFFRASGGPVSAGQPYVVGEAGPELFVPGASGTIVPNNARAASPFAGGMATVLVSIEASDYFDGRVLKVTGPVIAQASTRAAQGGSALARQDLARSALHRLD